MGWTGYIGKEIERGGRGNLKHEGGRLGYGEKVER